MKTLIVLTSPPACGKSTWAKRFKNDHPNTFIVSSDDIRIELQGKVDKRYIEDDLWDLFDKRVREYASQDLENLVVIADSNFYRNAYRTELVKNHPEFDRYVLVIFTCLFDESVENNKSEHERVVCPDDLLQKIWDDFEKPDAETLEYYDEFIRVIGNYEHTKVNN